MIGKKRESTPEQIRFADGAPTLRANGFYPIPLAWGASVPTFAYAANAYAYPNSCRPYHDVELIAVLCGVRPNPLLGLEECRATWLTAVQIVTSSKKIADIVDDLVAARFTKSPPVRLTVGTYDALYVFAFDGSVPVALGGSLRRFWLPKNKGTGAYEYCRVLSANDVFTYSGLCAARSIAGSDPNGPRVLGARATTLCECRARIFRRLRLRVRPHCRLILNPCLKRRVQSDVRSRLCTRCRNLTSRPASHSTAQRGASISMGAYMWLIAVSPPPV